MEFFHKAVSTVGSAIDRVQGYAAEAIVIAAQPAVNEEIETRVVQFRDATLSQIPQRCEESLREKVEASSAVSWVFNKVLGDNTDVLVANLIEHFRPGINNATQGLSANATDLIMGQLKDLLNGQEPSDGGAPPAADAAEVTQQVQQLQVSEEQPAPEQQSRGFDIPAQQPTSAPEGGEAAAGDESSGGFRRRAFGTAATVAGSVFGVEAKLPGFEASARELVHPLFENLKGQVWELVPAALQDVLGQLVGEKQDEVETNSEAAGVAGDEPEAPPGQASRGLSSWVQSQLTGKAGRVLDSVMAAALDALDGPLQSLIGRLVDELESNATAAAFAQCRQKLAEYKFISSA